mgnify:CR=1 FL=1
MFDNVSRYGEIIKILKELDTKLLFALPRMILRGRAHYSARAYGLVRAGKGREDRACR